MSDDTPWTPDFGDISASAPNWGAKRPVRIALLGDFGAGALRGRLETGADLGARRAQSVEFDNLDSAMARLDLDLQLPIGFDGANVGLELSELEAFHPDELYRNLSLFSAMAGLRKRLNNTATFAAAAAEMQRMAKGAGKRPSKRKSRAKGAAPASGASLSDFARLTGRADVAAPQASGIDALLKSMVGPFIQEAANPAKDALLKQLDTSLADAMRAVLHQADLQNLESLWRGVDFLLRRLETSHQLQVHLIDVSAEEFAADLSSCSDLSETGLYQLLVARPAKEAGGGYTFIGGLYQFDATPPHTELLGRMAQIAAHAGAPFITGMQTDSLSNRKKPPHPLVKQAFTALQRLPSASHLSLFGPRFLLRLPYGKRSDPVSSFAFEEFTPQDGLRGMLWGHPALLALCALATQGANLNLNDIPFHYFVDSAGDTTALPCTERLYNNEAATLLRSHGIGTLLAHKGEGLVHLSGLLAVDGTPLAASSSGKPSIKMMGARVALAGQMPSEKNDTRSAPRKKPDDDDSSSSDSSSDDSSASSDDSSSSDSDSSSEMDDLLASLGGDDSDNSSSSSDDSSSSSGDFEMDPDLAAMLKSLE